MANLAEATTLTAAQMAFFAEDELVTIIPSEPLPELSLASGVYGPFLPAEEVQVPLWLAARLRQRSQCVIVPPRWLSLDHLEKVNNTHGRQVTDREAEQWQLPYRWREIAHRILAVAEEDVPQASAVSNQIDHLWAKRANEMRNNLVVLAGEHEFFYVDITSLRVGSMELNTVRPFFVESASQLYALNSLRLNVAGGDRSQSQSETFSSTQPSRQRGDDGAPVTKQFRSDTQGSQ